MGYWEQDEQGHSFSSVAEGKMIWGDAPADIMGDALKQIIEVFKRDRGRAPTRDEVKAGLLFSLDVALETIGGETDA